MWSIFCLLALVSFPAVYSQEDDNGNRNDGMNDELLIRGRYEDLEKDWPVNTFRVERIWTGEVHAIHKAELFQEGEDWFIITSQYDDMLTHRGSFPAFQFDADEEEWADAGEHPQVRIDTLDYGSSVTTFTTSDGARWGWDSLNLIENNTLRSRAEISYTGNSYIFNWGANGFDADPAFSVVTYRAKPWAGWFATPDEREYLWTVNWGNDSWDPKRGADACVLYEYNGDTWSTADSRFIACPEVPAAPLVFENVNGEWVYLATSTGSVTRNGNTFGPINTQSCPQVWWYFRGTTGTTNTPSSRFELGTYMDNFNVPGAISFHHWQDSGFDYIIILTKTGVVTKRLWWETHYVEDLPTVATERAASEINWFDLGDRHCFILSYPGYGGRTMSKPHITDHYIPVYCWDGAHDNWDWAINVPAEGAWWAAGFSVEDDDDDVTYYFTTLQDANDQFSGLVLYRVILEDDLEWHIWFDIWEAGEYYFDHLKDRVHDVQALVITILALTVITFFNALILLLTSRGGGGGGGGGGDYKAYA